MKQTTFKTRNKLGVTKERRTQGDLIIDCRQIHSTLLEYINSEIGRCGK